MNILNISKESITMSIHREYHHSYYIYLELYFDHYFTIGQYNSPGIFKQYQLMYKLNL